MDHLGNEVWLSVTICVDDDGRDVMKGRIMKNTPIGRSITTIGQGLGPLTEKFASRSVAVVQPADLEIRHIIEVCGPEIPFLEITHARLPNLPPLTLPDNRDEPPRAHVFMQSAQPRRALRLGLVEYLGDEE